MATGDLTTVAAVQAFLSLKPDQDVDLLQTLVTKASAFVLNYINRNLLSQVYTETRNGQGGDTLPLYQSPITAVASVTIDDFVVPLSTKARKPGYVFDDTRVYLRDGYFARGAQNVVVQYTAGYAVIPAEVDQATVEIVATKYKRRTDLHVSGKTLNGETITYTMADLPASAKLALASYQRVFML